MAKDTKKPRKARVPVNPDETKGEKFVRLGNARTSKALKAIAQIGQLSGAGYESTPDQVQKIFQALGTAAEDAFKKFANKGAKQTGPAFTL